MGSINSFDPVVEEILLNNYLKSNFENLKIRDFATHFLEFHEGQIFLKSHLFFEL